MRNTPVDFNTVNQKIKESKIESVGKASIREIKRLIDEIEKATKEEYIRMEMGIPGLPPAQIGIEAEIEALRKAGAPEHPPSQ